MKLECPECGSKVIQTTLKVRYCRRCGYVVPIIYKDEFEDFTQEESK